MSKIVGLDLNIDQDYLAEAVKQTVLMGISESLNGKNEIVSQIVNSVLTQKVDKDGKVSSYDRDNRYTLLEVYVNNMLSEEVKAEMKAQIEEQRPKIREHIRKEMMKKNFVDDMSNAFISCVKGNLESDYRTKVNVLFNKVADEEY